MTLKCPASCLPFPTSPLRCLFNCACTDAEIDADATQGLKGIYSDRVEFQKEKPLFWFDLIHG